MGHQNIKMASGPRSGKFDDIIVLVLSNGNLFHETQRKSLHPAKLLQARDAGVPTKGWAVVENDKRDIWENWLGSIREDG
jgi:hypothetical protein